MTRNTFLDVCTILKNMPYGSAPPWNGGVQRIYEVGLRNMPDDGAAVLIEAIIDRCRFRPTVHEIVELWREIRSPVDASRVDQIVAALIALRQRPGEYVVPHPVFGAVIMEAGEPSWTDPVKQQIVRTFGGWVKFCRDESDPGVFRGHLLRVTQLVLGGCGDETINRLRIEYQQGRAAGEIESGGSSILALGKIVESMLGNG